MTAILLEQEKFPYFITDNTKQKFPKQGSETWQIVPAVRAEESANEYLIYIIVPGMKRENFTIKIKKNRLMVSARNKELKNFFSRFAASRNVIWRETFILPEDADMLMTTAVFRNGALEIHIPKGTNCDFRAPLKIFVY
ncbi:MAG: Hsp20/alpha crystallin family protein [Chitinophagaceae bacterium]|nr:Hsp20/alpha crystallin family protein [Chitinophagaceae bacterium]